MEKVYKTMKSVGIGDIVVGICVILAGCVSGALIITNGARLLHRKKDILF